MSSKSFKRYSPNIIDLCKDGEGYGGKSTDDADHEDDLASSLEPGHSVGVDRTADSEIAFTGEGEDGEDGGVLRHLRHHGPQPAADLAQLPGVLPPVDGEVEGDAHEQGGDVGTGQREEEQVGRGPHGNVPEDNDTDHAVTQRPRDPHQHIDGGERVQSLSG